MLCTPRTTRFRTRPDIAPYGHPADVQVLIHRDKLRIVEDAGRQLLFVVGEWFEGPEGGEKRNSDWCSFCGLLEVNGAAPPLSDAEVKRAWLLRSGGHALRG